MWKFSDNKVSWLKGFLSVVTVLICISFPYLPVFSEDSIETDFSKNHKKTIADCERLITDAMDKGRIPGMSVAIVDEKGLLWAKGFGYTDRSKKTRVTPDTIFSIQSISKTVTATLIMKAVQDGLLDLDKPITDYLPDFKVNSPFEKEPERKITVRHLLSHTAGFTHETSVGSNFDPIFPSFEEHIKSISDTWLKFPVGENYSYSNLGIDLAGYILQKQSGKPFHQYAEENIVKPLGMKNSTFDINAIKNSRNRAAGHNSFYWKMPLDIPMIPSGGFTAVPRIWQNSFSSISTQALFKTIAYWTVAT